MRTRSSRLPRHSSCLTGALEGALQLRLARAILDRPMLCAVTLLCRGMKGPVWIREMRTAERTEIRAASGDDPVHLVCFGDVADGDRSHSSLVPDPVAVGGLEHPPVHRLR